MFLLVDCYVSQYVNHLLLKASSFARRTASLIWERVEDRRYSLYFKGFMFVPTGGSTSPNIPSVMDEIVFNSSSSRLSIPPLFFAGRVLLREDGRQHRAPSSIYRRGCMPHHHFHLQLLYILRLGKLTRRGRPKVLMKIAHTHTNYKTILFYEAPGSYELTPSKFNSGGVESGRDQNHLHFYKACVIRGQMYHESSLSRRAWKLMTVLTGIRSQH